MFDKHVHITESGPRSVSVVHRHAPTDESVRLLREMESAAREKVTQAIRLENSPIDCVIHAQDDEMGCKRDFCIFVKVNGKRIEVRRSFDGFNASPDVVALGLLSAVSDRIAAEILAPAFESLPRQFKA